MRHLNLLTSLAAAAVTLSACAPVVAPVPAPRPVPPVVVVPAPVPSTGGLTPAQRAAATTVVNREMAKRLPGVNVAPYTACVVNNATMAEMTDLASMGANSAGAAGAVASIVKRPATTSCIAGISKTA